MRSVQKGFGSRNGWLILSTGVAVVIPLAQPGAQTSTTAQTSPALTVTTQAATNAPVADASLSANPDEIVCHTIPPLTGTRIGGSRECHTEREWDNSRKESQRVLASHQMMGLQGPLRDSAQGAPGFIAPVR